MSYSFSDFIAGFNGWIDFGVLWFVAALLIFTFVYVALRKWARIKSAKISFPGKGRIILFALAIGLITYVVRIFIPVG